MAPQPGANFFAPEARTLRQFGIANARVVPDGIDALRPRPRVPGQFAPSPILVPCGLNAARCAYFALSELSLCRASAAARG